MIKYDDKPCVKFFDKPNATGYCTNIELILSANGKSVSAIAQVNDNYFGFELYGNIEAIAASLDVSEEQLIDATNSYEFDEFCKQAIRDVLTSMIATDARRFLNLRRPDFGDLVGFADALNLADSAGIEYDRFGLSDGLASLPTGDCSKVFDTSGIYSWDSESDDSNGYPDYVLTDQTGRWSVEPAKDYIAEMME